MKNSRLALLLLFLAFCGDSYANLTKNVLYLPSTTAESEENLKKSSSVTNHLPMAWIAGSVIKSPIKQLSVCLWVKSLNQDASGTLFAYLTKERKIDFGLVGFQNGNKNTEFSDEDSYLVYLVVKGKRSKIPISLRLDDVRWHHVCITWSSRYGQWRAFLDGVKVKYGLGLKRGRSIDPNGTYFLGGAETQMLEDGEEIVNGTEDSRVELIASTSFKTSRRKRAIFSPLIQRFVGKITDLYAWKKVLLKEQIRQLYDCTERFRNKFRNEVSSQLENIRDLFKNTNDGSQKGTKKKQMSWWGKSIIYAWDVTTLSLRRPAQLKRSGSLCGSMVTVECESDYMLVTVDKAKLRSYNLRDSQIHLRNASCVPDEKENHWVFNVRDLTSCGTTRTMSGRDIVFSNEVSNGDQSSPVIYTGRQFSVSVRCNYPADITASTRQFIPGATPELVGRTMIENPTTKKRDLEAVFVLFEDDNFSTVYHEKTLLDSNDTVYGGIVVKGIDQRSNENVNVVVDSCVMDADQQRITLLDPTNCHGSTTTLLENGQIPQVRMRLSAGHKIPRKPSYIECGIYPCVGSKCIQPCSQNAASNPGNPGTSNRLFKADRRSRKQRAISEARDEDTKPKIYYIRLGPIYYKEKEFDSSNQGETESEDISYPIPVIPCLAILVILTMAAIFSVFFLSRRTRALRYADMQWDSLEGTVKNKKQSIRANSFIYQHYNSNIYSIHATNCLTDATCQQFTEV